MHEISRIRFATTTLSPEKIDFINDRFRISCECSVVCGRLSMTQTFCRALRRSMTEDSTTKSTKQYAHQVVPLPCNRMQYRCVLLLCRRTSNDFGQECVLSLLRGIDFFLSSTTLTPSSPPKLNRTLTRTRLFGSTGIIFSFPLKFGRIPSVPHLVHTRQKISEQRRWYCTIVQYNIYIEIDREREARRPQARPAQGEESVALPHYCGCERGRLGIRLIENREV